jgi:hypothetical protein
MKLERRIPTKLVELLDMSSTYFEAVKGSPLFDPPAARALVESLGGARDCLKVGCEEARFHDQLKVAARNGMEKDLVTALKRVIHYIEAMASDDDLKELQKKGIRLAKPKTRKRKSKADQAELELAPAGG